MAILHSCCCWNNVRSGSLAASIYTLILSVINGCLIGYNLVVLDQGFPHQPTGGEHDGSDTEVEGVEVHPLAPLQILYWWFLVTMVVCIMLFATSILVFIGLSKNNRFLLLPWMGATVTMVCIDTAVLIYQCVIFGLLTFNVIQMVIWLALTLLNVYCIMCVISQYQELKAGRGTLDYIRRQRIAMVYHPAIQQVHITQGPIVMACPGVVTSSTQVRHNNTGQPAVTTTVMVTPPDYNVATSQIPRYSVVTAQDSAQGGSEEPLLNNLASASITDKKESPPPPYQP